MRFPRRPLLGSSVNNGNLPLVRDMFFVETCHLTDVTDRGDLDSYRIGLRGDSRGDSRGVGPLPDGAEFVPHIAPQPGVV
jgi:hypothetical protein